MAQQAVLGIPRGVYGGKETEAGLPEADEIGFCHTTLALCGLPYRRPPVDQLEFVRRNGRASLLVTAGKLVNPANGEWEPQGLPYGPRARLLLIYLCSEALRNRDPVVNVGDSMTAFMRLLGISASGGRKGTISPFKEQINRLSASRMQIGLWSGGGSITIEAQPIKSTNIWLPAKSGEKSFWASTLILDGGFYDSLQRFAVPLDYRAINALKSNALALDIYSWLAHRLHRIRAPAGDFITWRILYAQFGGGYRRLIDFKRKFRHSLGRAVAVYSDARIEETDKGLRLRRSPPPVAREAGAGQRLHVVAALSPSRG